MSDLDYTLIIFPVSLMVPFGARSKTTAVGPLANLPVRLGSPRATLTGLSPSLADANLVVLHKQPKWQEA